MKISKANGDYLRLDDLTPSLKKGIKLVVPQNHLIDTNEHMFVKNKYAESVTNVAVRMNHSVSWASASSKGDLHLTSDAPAFLIRAVWKALAAHWHPDKHGGDSKMFDKYREAYENIKEE